MASSMPAHHYLAEMWLPPKPRSSHSEDSGAAVLVTGGRGCLSLKRYVLYNPEDAARAGGFVARYLLGDDPKQFMRPGGKP